MAILVDSNVLLDVLTLDSAWYAWSAAQLEIAADSERLVINPIIYAEVSAGFDRIEDLDEALPGDYFCRAGLPWGAAFLAGQCFLTYRRRHGVKTFPLPDFYIGAHAAIEGMRLLTRDTKRYTTYFPKLELITP